MKQPTTEQGFMRKAKRLTRVGRVSDKAMGNAMGKLKGAKGSQIPTSKPRGGVGPGMAGN